MIITKHSIGPVIAFCIWSLLLAVLGASVSSVILSTLIVLTSVSMLYKDIRDKLVEQHKEYKALDHLVHLALAIWMLTWVLAFPVAFYIYIISFILCNAFMWKARYDETTD